MGNCISASKRIQYSGKPASIVGSVGHLGSGNEDNVTVTSFGGESDSDHNKLCSVDPSSAQKVPADSPEVADITQQINDDRRGSITPSIERAEEADVAVVQGYAEPNSFRILRRQNDQSSIEALEKALRGDPILKSAKIKIEGAPSRRPTALGVPIMQ